MASYRSPFRRILSNEMTWLRGRFSSSEDIEPRQAVGASNPAREVGRRLPTPIAARRLMLGVNLRRDMPVAVVWFHTRLDAHATRRANRCHSSARLGCHRAPKASHRQSYPSRIMGDPSYTLRPHQ